MVWAMNLAMSRWADLVASLRRLLAAGSGSGAVKAGPFASEANDIVDSLTSGDFDAVAAKFDPTMSAHLHVSDLANNWRTYQEVLGTYRSHSAPISVMRGQLDVERVPLILGDGKGEVRITFHPDGTVAGLYFLKSGAPLP
jgi:hypothetical protein